jgi:hypothetical protein
MKKRWNEEMVIVKSFLAFVALLPLVLLMLPGSAVMMVPKADLTFEGGVEIYGPEAGTYSPGEVLTVSVKVKNVGEVDAKNVDVLFYVDGAPNKVQTLRIVENASGGIKTVIFTWVAEVGTHNLSIKLDPDDTVLESSEDDNSIWVLIDIEEAQIPDPVSGEQTIESSAVLFPSMILLVIIGGAALFIGAIAIIGIGALIYFVNKN